MGTSVRKDVLELLEKRVRSRFSHQQLAVLEPCALHPSAVPLSDVHSPGETPGAAQPWQRRRSGREVLAAGDAPLAVLAAMLRLPAAANEAATPAHADFARRFNAAAEAAVQDPRVADALSARHCWPSGAAQGVLGGGSSDLASSRREVAVDSHMYVQHAVSRQKNAPCPGPDKEFTADPAEW